MHCETRKFKWLAFFSLCFTCSSLEPKCRISEVCLNLHRDEGVTHSHTPADWSTCGGETVIRVPTLLKLSLKHTHMGPRHTLHLLEEDSKVQRGWLV